MGYCEERLYWRLTGEHLQLVVGKKGNRYREGIRTANCLHDMIELDKVDSLS